MNEDLFSPESLAEYLGIPLATVYQMNYRHTAPHRIKIGRHVRYRKIDVDKWLEKHTVPPSNDAA